MSVVNLSSLFANQIGSVISYSLGITSNNFEHFRYFILIANFSAFLPLPFLMLINDNDYVAKDPEVSEDEEEKNNLLNNGLKNYLEKKHDKKDLNNLERMSHNNANKNFNYEKLLNQRNEDEIK